MDLKDKYKALPKNSLEGRLKEERHEITIGKQWTVTDIVF
jgi:hypothetical protein